MDDWLGIGWNYWSGIIASVVVAGFYLFAGASRRGRGDPGNPFKPRNPLVITAGVFGRASLTNLQVFYFSLIVFWILFYYLLRYGELSGLSADVLYLLGIGAAGTGGAKIVAINRKRLSFNNWAWLKRKKWITDDIGEPREPPKWTDLITDEGAFDVNKFQTLFISLAVGIALLVAALKGSAGEVGAGAPITTFEIPEELLGLLGLSQTMNVGGRAIAPAPLEELDKQLDEVRRLEAEFVAKVGEVWAKSPPPPEEEEMAAAKKVARTEYEAYLDAAGQAAEMVRDRIKAVSPTENLEPSLPKCKESGG